MQLTKTLQTSDANDAYERMFGTGFGTADLTLHVDTDEININNYIAGVWYPAVPILPGSTILSATWELRCYSIPVALKSQIAAHDVASADDFSANPDLDGRWKYARTSASVRWNTGPRVGGTWYTSPSIVSVMQEVVNLPGWAENNPCCLMMAGDGDDVTAKVNSWHSATVATNGPKLHLTWLVAGLEYTGEIEVESDSAGFDADLGIASQAAGDIALESDAATFTAAFQFAGDTGDMETTAGQSGISSVSTMKADEADIESVADHADTIGFFYESTVSHIEIVADQGRVELPTQLATEIVVVTGRPLVKSCVIVAADAIVSPFGGGAVVVVVTGIHVEELSASHIIVVCDVIVAPLAPAAVVACTPLMIEPLEPCSIVAISAAIGESELLVSTSVCVVADAIVSPLGTTAIVATSASVLHPLPPSRVVAVSAGLVESVEALSASTIVAAAAALVESVEALSATAIVAVSTQEELRTTANVVAIAPRLIALPDMPLASTAIVAVSTQEEPLTTAVVVAITHSLIALPDMPLASVAIIAASAAIVESVEALSVTAIVAVSSTIVESIEALRDTAIVAVSTQEQSLTTAIGVAIAKSLIALPDMPLTASAIVAVSTHDEPLTTASVVAISPNLIALPDMPLAATASVVVAPPLVQPIAPLAATSIVAVAPSLLQPVEDTGTTVVVVTSREHGVGYLAVADIVAVALRFPAR